ncbi:MAG: class II fructose-bisphosphate aldolase [Armatimonadota bacterium]
MNSLRGEELKKVIEAASATGTMIPAFNIPYLPMAKVVAQTLEKHGTFGMMEVARLELVKFEAGSLSEIKEQYNQWANPRFVSMHLDHVPVIDEDDLNVDWEPLITEGVALGFGSVMIDGSRLPLEGNIKATSRVVEIAHSGGSLVEAELGAVLGHSAGPMPPYEELFASRTGFTDPDEAGEFVRRTGVDWLSVSIGSFHGPISGASKDKAKMPAKLDIELLKEIRKATGIPIVLHGGSGVIQSYIDEAIANGMVKVNIAADIRRPYEQTLAQTGDVEKARSAVEETMDHLICDVYHLEGSASRLID